jgi:hypothetical protein
MNGFELILPFLRPIQHLILDPEISEIMVNGPEYVFIERAGRVEEVPGLTLSRGLLKLPSGTSHSGWGMLISVPASALVIGSWVALASAACFVLVTLRRAQLEDEFLKRNLPGYTHYARRVPPKLLPAKRVFRSFYAQHKPQTTQTTNPARPPVRAAAGQ